MEEGFERYRLKDWNWFREYYEKLGSEEYWAFDQLVHHAIETLLPFCRYDLSRIPADKQDLFIKIACEYIIENGGIDQCGIQFTSDWKFLIRTMQYTKK